MITALRVHSKAEAGPQRALFRRIDDAAGRRLRDIGRRKALAGAEKAQAAPEQAARRRDQLELRFGAVTVLQYGAHVAERIDQAERQAAFSRPEQAGEQLRVVGEL